MFQPPEDDQKLMPKHIGPIINKNNVHQLILSIKNAWLVLYLPAPMLVLHFPDTLFLL